MNNKLYSNGLDEINKAKDLMYKINNIQTKPNKSSTIEFQHLGPDGNVYGIIRENHEYYIKIAKPKHNLTVDDFNYIGGIQNKPKYAYSSYGKAAKQLKLKFISLNEALNIEPERDTNLLKENQKQKKNKVDYIEEICDIDETNYKLKIDVPSDKQTKNNYNKRTTNNNDFDEFFDKKNVDSKDISSDENELKTNNDELDDDNENLDFEPNNEDADDVDDDENINLDSDDENDDDEDLEKKIQRLTGKLGQALRDYSKETDEIDFKLEKFVLNSIISATHTGQMKQSDLNSIIKKLKSSGKKNDKENNDDVDDDDKKQDLSEQTIIAKLKRKKILNKIYNNNNNKNVKNMLNESQKTKINSIFVKKLKKMVMEALNELNIDEMIAEIFEIEANETKPSPTPTPTETPTKTPTPDKSKKPGLDPFRPVRPHVQPIPKGVKNK